jgi:hypothetical protein
MENNIGEFRHETRPPSFPKPVFFKIERDFKKPAKNNKKWRKIPVYHKKYLKLLYLNL